MNSDKHEPGQSGHRNVEYLTIGVDSDSQRIDNFLITHWKGVPKSRIYRLIRKGEIRVNKKRVKADTRLFSGDILRLPPVRMADPVEIEPPGQNLQTLIRDSILFENDDMLIVNKPPGIAVHGGTGQRTGFIEALRWMRMNGAGTDVFLELAHRIDKETSGCLIICKSAQCLKYVQEAFKARHVTKIYLALVHGRWPRELHEVAAPLQKIIINADEKVVRVNEGGKSAKTLFRILKEFPGATLVEAQPLTGRMHQIRVHCQFAGHPIVGDSKYTQSALAGARDWRKLCLHAASVQFDLPEGKGRVNVSAPLHSGMEALMNSL